MPARWRPGQSPRDERGHDLRVSDDEPRASTAGPRRASTFTGRARLGITLSGRNGDWAYDGAGRIHITFGWQRCEADGSQCVAIAGSDYRHEVTEDDLGHPQRRRSC